MNFKNHRFALSVLALILAPSAQAATGAPAVVVKTWGEHRAGNIVFYHEVTNNSLRNVVGISIAEDTDNTGDANVTKDQGELWWGLMPINSGTGIDGEPGVDPAAVSGPAGWRAQILQIEWGGRFLEWRRPPRPGLPIQPGQTVRFSVTVPNSYMAQDGTGQIRYFGIDMTTMPDNPYTGYLSGHFSAHYADGKEPWHYNSQMELVDKTPPSLTVTLSPNTLRPNEKLVPITATIAVKDDYDPQPEIKLESITANEVWEAEDVKANIGTDTRQFLVKAEREGKNKTGRIYTVIYSATDASGNKSIASATVTVPHDQDDHEKDERRYKDRQE